MLRSLGAQGVITDLGTGHVEVQVGRLRIRAGLDDLSRPEASPSKGRDASRQPTAGLG
jgi:hypothetical protein